MSKVEFLDDEDALRTGANSFLVDFEQFREWKSENKWVHQQVLVGVASGKWGGLENVDTLAEP
jgi:hypothetical protein